VVALPESSALGQSTKSVTPSRIAENFDVFDFGHDDADMAAITKLNSSDGRICPDPMTATF
jgi:2,5-diketo-D-gluconate reductase A